MSGEQAAGDGAGMHPGTWGKAGAGGCCTCSQASGGLRAVYRPEEVGLVIRPAIAGPLSDIEYLACADDLPTCAQLQQRLARSAAEANATAAGYTGPACD